MTCDDISSGMKCGKCRIILIVGEDYHPRNLNKKVNESLWYLDTNSIPEWIADGMDQVSHCNILPL